MSANPGEDDAKKVELALAAQLLAEHFDAAVLLVTYRDAWGNTKFLVLNQGNAFACAKLVEDYAEGNLATDPDPDAAISEDGEEAEA